jgi:hypothetical protein
MEALVETIEDENEKRGDVLVTLFSEWNEAKMDNPTRTSFVVVVLVILAVVDGAVCPRQNILLDLCCCLALTPLAPSPSFALVPTLLAVRCCFVDYSK